MSTSLIEATYWGKGDSYFVAGNTYTLLVAQLMFGRIRVTPCHGYENKPYKDMDEQYSSLGDFFRKWQPGRCIQADINALHFYFGDNQNAQD